MNKHSNDKSLKRLQRGINFVRNVGAAKPTEYSQQGPRTNDHHINI